LNDCSAQVFPYNIFAYCSICRVDCKFVRKKIYQMVSVVTFFIRLYSPFVGPWPLFSVVLILYTVGRTPWTGDQPVARPLPTHRTTRT
jgi:hypothetical protein